LLLPTLRAQDSLDRRGAALDLIVQALELMSGRATTENIRRAISRLQTALDEDPNFADAYYYRSLCLKRLNENPNRQAADLAAARRLNSEALRDQRDPFLIAAPRIDLALGPVSQKWALVVGISRFNPDAGAAPLQYAAPDATAFAELLRDPKAGRFPANQVFLLTNAQATTANIKARMNTIARNAKPQDIVVVYLSTHGSARSDDLKSVSYLMTYDTDVGSRDSVFGSALPMVDVSGILANRCAAQRTVAIFDTCHSGAAAPGQAALATDDFDRLRNGAGRYVISSCQADQLAYEGEGHGYFTASFIKNFRAGQGCLRLGDLFTRVQADVAETVRRKAGKAQRPVLVKSESSAEIVLGAPVGQASTVCA
jgi:hypothetical protein